MERTNIRYVEKDDIVISGFIYRCIFISLISTSSCKNEEEMAILQLIKPQLRLARKVGKRDW